MSLLKLHLVIYLLKIRGVGSSGKADKARTDKVRLREGGAQ